jgi:branched-chain amino acid transport system permease protein
VRPEGVRGRRMSRRLLVDLAVLVVVTVIFAFGRSFESNALLLVEIMVYVVLAQGVNVSYGFTGYLPFGYVGFFGAGAYGAAVAVMELKQGAPVAILFGLLSAVVVALILSPLLRLRGAYFAIASLAAAEALFFIVSNPSAQPITNGPYGANLATVFNSNASYLFAVAVVAISLAVVAWLRNSRFGLSLRAVRVDQEAAAMAGVNVVRTRTLAWVLSAALAGLAGASYAWVISTFYPSAVFDLSTSVFAIVFALFGGVGTLVGPVLGTVILYGIYNAIGVSEPQYFELIYGLLIVAIVLFLPGGLASIGRWLAARVRRGESRGPTDGAPASAAGEPASPAGLAAAAAPGGASSKASDNGGEA